MNFSKTLLASALLASTAMPAAALTTYVYVNPNGSDSNSCLSIDLPCKTITHAVELAQPGWRVQPSQGTFCENVKITKSGSGPRGQIEIVPLNGPKTIVDASCSPNPFAPALEITGSYIYFVGNMIFTGSRTNGVYIHGTDSSHLATGVHISQSVIKNNAGHNVMAYNAPFLDLGYGHFSASGKEGITISSSPNWFVHDMNIFNAGPVSAPVACTSVKSSPHGTYEDNNGKESGCGPNLYLERSPYAVVTGNIPYGDTGTQKGVFTYVVVPQSDFATDTFSDNGTP